MPKIFICYRREDSAMVTTIVYQRLKQRYGDKNVFMDLETLPYTADFRDYIRDFLQRCDLFVAVIGDRWLGMKNDQGKRRIDQPDDFVRIEIEAALDRNIRILPLLIDAAAIPPASAVPESLRPLVHRHAFRLRAGRDFDRDLNDLLKTIARILPPIRKILLWLAVTALLVAVALTSAAVWWQRKARIEDAEVARLRSCIIDAISIRQWSAADKCLAALEIRVPDTAELPAWIATIKQGRLADRLTELRESIRKAVVDKKWDEGERLLDELLGLTPGDTEALRWRAEIKQGRELAQPTAVTDGATPGRQQTEGTRQGSRLSDRDRERLRQLIATMNLRFVDIQPGVFLMGSTTGHDDEMPIHLVRITRGFQLGIFEVTQAQWKTIMDNNPSGFKGPHRPVEQVSWSDVQRFIAKLNQADDGWRYALPTEAEWEYACRAGAAADAAQDLPPTTWFADNSGGGTHPAGQTKPNAWGLYDALGNVAEWVQDYYDAGYYSKSPSDDPPGPASGTRRVMRGGAWDYRARTCRPSNRGSESPDHGDDNLGFRLARRRLSS
jgi:formylglycine-generating enzyme required for sulfatase activity